MASTQDPSFPLRLFVDTQRNRVVVAEASGHFVDALFSFLTLPLGTLLRLVSKKQAHQPVEIGCINNLCQSVENLDAQVFWHQICKQMLLCPRNSCETLCQKLRFNVDDTEPSKYWMCGSCRGGNDRWLSTFAGVSCLCGKVMDKEMKLLEEDDSKGSSVQQLVQLGYRDLSNLTEVSPNVGLEEILKLLKRALISKSPLSDVFLAPEDERSNPICSFTPIARSNNVSWSICDCLIDLKITVSKSENKILYAEAEADFADFLFSFLTIPLGSIINRLHDNVSLGSMDNLYRSVKGLSLSWFKGQCSPPLLDLGVAPQYGCMTQPLSLREEQTPTYWYGTGVIRDNIVYKYRNGVISTKKHLIQNPSALKLFDPRSPDGNWGRAVGIVRRPAVFTVMDDLQVTPLTSASSISFLQKLNCPLDDLEEHVVRIGTYEARNLLVASLTSKAALTKGLFYLLKKPKEEATA